MKKVCKPYKFSYFKTIADFSAAMAADGMDFPITDDLSILMEPLTLANGHVIPNRMVIQPLEGFDGTKDGNPSDLIFRRYKRYAEGGAGLIWYESITVADDGRCNPLQMIIKEETVPEIKRLVGETDAAAIAKYGRKAVAAEGKYSYMDLSYMYIMAEKLFPAVPIASLTIWATSRNA